VIELAHGIGTRTDLPIPVSLALYGAGMAVAISFFTLVLLWKRPKLHEPEQGRALPIGLQRTIDSPVFRRVLQAVTLALAVLVVVVGLVGPPRPTGNIAPYALYITFWVGLVPLSLLFGPVWRVVNPLRLVHALLRPLAGAPPAPQIADRVGYWPAAVSLAVFVWLELVYPERAQPAVVAMFLVVYAVVHLVASLWVGERWFDRGDGFEVYSTLIGRFSPWGRRADGRLALRNPLVNAATTPAAPGLAAVVITLVGSTAFDGLTRTEFWTAGPGAANDALSGTLGLAFMIALTAALYLLGTMLNGWAASDDPLVQPGRYAHTIIPIAVGYTVAHYFSLLLIDGQLTWILASDPFRTGADFFGTAAKSINYTIVSSATIAYVQVAAIVFGHVLGVLLAHDQALRDSERSNYIHQLPLAIVMIAYTIGGLGLLFGFGEGQ
jgi:hypothetical protein